MLMQRISFCQGVAGFRLDAAKSIPPSNISAILGALSGSYYDTQVLLFYCLYLYVPTLILMTPHKRKSIMELERPLVPSNIPETGQSLCNFVSRASWPHSCPLTAMSSNSGSPRVFSPISLQALKEYVRSSPYCVLFRAHLDHFM